MSSPVSHGTLAGALWGMALLLLAIADTTPASAQVPPSQDPVPPQVQQFLQSMQDPAVRTWVERQLKIPAAPQAAEGATPSEMMTEPITGLREHLLRLAAAVPRLPAEIRAGAARLLDEVHGWHLLGVLAATFIALGAGAEWLFRRVTWPLFWRRVRSMPTASVAERLRLIGFRLAFWLSEVAIFALGSVGAFLAFDWPPLLREIVITYLIAAVGLRLVLVSGRFLLAPAYENAPDIARFRLVPTTTVAARYWYRRLMLFAGWFALGWATVSAFRTLGLPPEIREMVAYALGLGLLALALEVVWTRPRPAPAVAPEERTPRHVSHALGASVLSIYLVLL